MAWCDERGETLAYGGGNGTGMAEQLGLACGHLMSFAMNDWWAN